MPDQTAQPMTPDRLAEGLTMDEEESEHEECLGIHNSVDGYRDCDGNPI